MACGRMRSTCGARVGAGARRERRARGRWSVRARAETDVSERTMRLLSSIERGDGGERALGAGGQTTVDALRALDGRWAALRALEGGGRRQDDGPEFTRRRLGRGVEDALTASDSATDATGVFDVAVCGGTLGILAATALQRRGAKVCVIERGPLAGRDQEWNVSRKEIEELATLGVLSKEDVEACVMIEFNPIRCGFNGNGGKDLMTRDILNTGVSPARLVERCRARFEDAGGVVFERAVLGGVDIYDDGAVLDVSGKSVNARLVIDCMGFASPIVRQIRGKQKPDGVCVVVGSCAEGFKENTGADLIYTTTDIEEDFSGQYFWEAFPASTGPDHRTTYMFTYMDAQDPRPSVAAILENYWDYMPKYQNLESMDDVRLKRVLFGLFPTYRDSPLQTEFDRVLQIGDASGIQSPLSFGGLAAILRHLGRITCAVEEALDSDCLDRNALRAVNEYQPALSAAWLFQRCMMVPHDAKPKRDFINKLMTINFGVMENLGEDVLRPFLQDVVTFKGLGKTLISMTLTKPLFVPNILLQAGPGPIADWFKHFAMLGVYDSLSTLALKALDATAPTEVGAFGFLSPRQKFMLRRKCEAIVYGAGRDHTA